MSNDTQTMYGISRIDDKAYHTHAWRVSLKRRGKSHVKNFPDKKHGGKRKALRLAQRYRDELIRKHPPLSRKEFSGIKRRNNQTGVVGVYRFAVTYRLKNGKKRYSWCWEANWPTTPGKSESARFAVNKFGEQGAFKRAYAARKRGMSVLEGVFWASERGMQLAAKRPKTTRVRASDKVRLFRRASDNRGRSRRVFETPNTLAA